MRPYGGTSQKYHGNSFFAFTRQQTRRPGSHDQFALSENDWTEQELEYFSQIIKEGNITTILSSKEAKAKVRS